jgi:hypothetical protein
VGELLSSPEIALPLLIVGLYCVLQSLTSWVTGIRLLIVALMFGGIAGARAGVTILPIAFRDALIVLPLYVAFAASKAGRQALARVPPALGLGVGAVIAWIALSLFNPNSLSGLQLMIGLKVWLFYMPFVVVGIALASRPEAMFKIFRTLLVCGLVACGVGLAQAALVRAIGYEPAMSLFFGASASAVTQRFAEFSEGGGIYRIPGTFSFAAQYVEFLFLFIVVTAIEANTDPDSRYRRLGRIAFYFGILAGLFSGTKAAFLAFPVLACLFLAFGLIRGRLAIGAPIALAIGAVAIEAAKLDPLALASFGLQQAQGYSQGFVLDQIAAAVRYGPLGQGIGSSTGAARFATGVSTAASQLGFESYYAKIAAELGTIGLTIFAILFLGIAIKTVMIAHHHRTRSGNVLVAPLAIYVLMNLVYSFKGFVIDTDPGNVFFWLSLGLMLGLCRNLRTASIQRDDAALAEDRLSAAPN